MYTFLVKYCKNHCTLIIQISIVKLFENKKKQNIGQIISSKVHYYLVEYTLNTLLCKKVE